MTEFEWTMNAAGAWARVETDLTSWNEWPHRLRKIVLIGLKRGKFPFMKRIILNGQFVLLL